MKSGLKHIPFFGSIVLLGMLYLQPASAQVRVSGKVYDMSQSNPLEAVSVLSTSGRGTITDEQGRFTLVVPDTDSIWFSYLNKPTPKYAVSSIPNIENFEISLHVNMVQLKEVRVMPRNYRMDSIQNRKDYARVFDFRKPGLGTSLSVGPSGGAGLNITELANMFKFRQNRRMLSFQERLIREEEEKFIEYRFSRALIIKLTGLRPPELDSFINRYRPSVDFIGFATDYELGEYIKAAHQHYQRYKRLLQEIGKPEDFFY